MKPEPTETENPMKPEPTAPRLKSVSIPIHWTAGEANAVLDFLHELFLTILAIHGPAIRREIARDSPLYEEYTHEFDGPSSDEFPF